MHSFPIVIPGCIITDAPIQLSSPIEILADFIYLLVHFLSFNTLLFGAEDVMKVTLGASATLSPKIILGFKSGESISVKPLLIYESSPILFS